MSRKYKFHESQGCYFVTATVVDWVDVFTRDNYRQIILDSLTFCQNTKGLVVHAWVLMTNHLHMIISSDGRMPLGSVMRDFKRHTSTAMRKSIKLSEGESRKDWMMYRFGNAGRHNGNNWDFQFWQQGNQPILLKDAATMQRALNYVHQNPVVAGFVTDPHHWWWSSAVDYYGGKGLLNLVMIDV